MDQIIVNGLVGLVLIALSFPLHELLHWLPMRFYGLNTKLGIVRRDLTIEVSCDAASFAQAEIILLSPLAADMPTMFIALLFLFNFPDPSWYILLVPLAMAWGCFNSLHDILELKRLRDTK